MVHLATIDERTSHKMKLRHGNCVNGGVVYDICGEAMGDLCDGTPPESIYQYNPR